MLSGILMQKKRDEGRDTAGIAGEALRQPPSLPHQRRRGRGVPCDGTPSALRAGTSPSCFRDLR